jgi:hypothetical protein
MSFLQTEYKLVASENKFGPKRTEQKWGLKWHAVSNVKLRKS